MSEDFTDYNHKEEDWKEFNYSSDKELSPFIQPFQDIINQETKNIFIESVIKPILEYHKKLKNINDKIIFEFNDFKNNSSMDFDGLTDSYVFLGNKLGDTLKELQDYVQEAMTEEDESYD